MFLDLLKDNLFLIISVALVLSVAILFASYAFFKGLQQRGYKKRGYLVWLYKNDGRYVSRACNVMLFSFFSYILFNVLFTPFLGGTAGYLGLLSFVLFLAIYRRSQMSQAERQKLQLTARMKRLMAVTCLLYFVVIFVLMAVCNYLAITLDMGFFASIRFAPITLLPLLFPFFVILADNMLKPYEGGIRSKYKKLASEKLSKREDLICIGITGSFAKTTVKNILGTILAEKYSVFFTPKSYNTPMGISRAILEGYDGEEVFIAEMGARRRGEIEELAKFIPCDIGVITAVCRQHLEGFKNLDNILDTKFELAQNLKDNGVMFYNLDNQGAKTLSQREQGEMVACGLDEGKDVLISDIKVVKEGCEFVISIGGESRRCKTKLLGVHNISNISLALSVAYRMGLTIEQMASGISKIQPIPHRLQIVPTSNNVTVIDDSYNANVAGTKAGLEVLKLFDGAKVVVTSGFVEMGNMEKYENNALGKRMATVCDHVIIVGTRLASDIVEGLISQGFLKENIHIISDMSEINGIIAMLSSKYEQMTMMFLADLPDSYLK